MLTLGLTRPLGAFLAGEEVSWEALGLSVAELAAVCEAHELWPLVAWRLSGSDRHGWPDEVRQTAARHGREAAAMELLRRRETVRVLAALSAAGIRALVMKGTALAYSLYPTPSLRSRDDTDLLIAESDIDEAARVLAALGYSATPLCSDVLRQFEMQYRDADGVVHAFDVHWNISSQRVFDGVVSFAEARDSSTPLIALGPAAQMLACEDALILSCIHPTMHHRNQMRALWLYDIHLLVTALGNAGLNRFASRARRIRVAAVCATALSLAAELFRTSIPAEVMRSLTETAREPSAAYLASGRRWHQDMIASLRAVEGFGPRMRLLGGILVPSANYMLFSAQKNGKRPPVWKLPVLYAQRQAQGAWKVLAGKK